MEDISILNIIIIMERMSVIDIHSHIIQGLDDGSKDIDISLDMARIYLENGINKVIATPHHIEKDNFLVEGSKESLDILKDQLEKNNLDLKVYLGSEVYIYPDMLKDMEEDKIMTLNGSRYLLIEFPIRDIPLYVESIIYGLLIKGYIPIIAHPERYLKVQENPNILYTLLKNGAMAQLNLSSLEGFYGKTARRTAKTLLRHKMIQFIATDAHNNTGRSPQVQKSLKILKNIVSSRDYRLLTSENANNILEDKIFIPFTPIKYNKKKFRAFVVQTLKRWLKNLRR